MKTVLLVIENEKGEILFLLRKKKPFGWALPGGKVNDGETSELALIREVWEETGIEILVGDSKFSHTGKSVSGVDIDIYSIKLGYTPDVIINNNEHLNKRWIMYNNENYAYAGNTRLFLEKL